MKQVDKPLDIDVARKIFENTDESMISNQAAYRESLSYYRNKNKIVRENKGNKDNADQEKKSKNPLRKHDSRVSSNFHQLLVDEKAAYTGSIPPAIDAGSDRLNNDINKVLGDHWQQTIQKLIVDSSLSGTAWLHVWHADDGEFKYAVVPPNEVTPIYKSSLTHELLAVRRTYEQLDPDSGDVYIFNEYWTATTATFFKRKQGEDYSTMVYNQRVAITDSVNDEALGNSPVLEHGFNGVPFIPFYNNDDHTPDLNKYKGLIDVYDLVYNGFVNDVQDVQQVIFILTNYDGTSLGEFLSNLQEYSAVKFDNDGPSDKSGLSTMSIEIPVEARNALLDRTFNNIFIYGQGVNPNDLKLGTSLSGVAIKMLYGKLELKAGQLESQYRPSISQLVRFILDELNKNTNQEIKQTWTRTSIQNDVEKATIVAQLADHTSDEAIAKNNPLVDDWQAELQDQKREAEERAQTPDPFANPDPMKPDDEEGDDDGKDDEK